MIKHILTGLLLFIIALFAVLIFLIMSPTGTQITANLLQRYVPNLSIGKAQGTIARKLTITHLHYQNNSLDLNIDKLAINWHGLGLLLGELDIKSLQIQHMDLNLTSANKKQDEQTNDSFHLPIQLKIRKAVITDITIHHNQHRLLTAKQINLTAHTWHRFGRQNLKLHIKWQQLTFAINKQQTVTSDEGMLTSEGQLDDYQIKLKANLKPNFNLPGSSQHEALLLLNANGDLNGFEKLTLQLKNSGKLRITGKVNWQPYPSWDLKLIGNKLDPSVIWADYPGAINFTAQTSGNYKDKLRLKLKTDELSGHLRQQPLIGKINLAIKDKQYIIHELHITLGQATIYAQGEIAKNWHLNWRINIPDLNKLSPKAYGLIQSQGQISGSRQTPRIQGDINAQKLSYRTLDISTLSATTDINTQPQGHSRLKLNASDLHYKKINVKQVNLTLSGSTSQQQIKLSLQRQKQYLSLQAIGGLQQKVWRGQIQDFSYISQTNGQWQLNGKPKLTVGKQRLILSPFCMRNASQSICLTVNWLAKQNSLAHLVVKNLNLKDLVSQGLGQQQKNLNNFNSRLNLDLTVNRNSKGKLSGKANGNLTPGVIAYNINNQALSLPIRSGMLTATLNQQGLNLVSKIDFSPGQRLDLDFKMPNYHGNGLPGKNEKINGQANINLDELSVIALFVPNLSKISGRLGVNLKLAGTLAKPKISGIARLNHGTADIPSLGLNLTNIQLTATGDQNGIIEYKGTAVAGGGEFNLSGRSDLTKSGFPTELHLNGQRLLVVNTPGYKVYASPDLKLNYQNKTLNITGTVKIPEAKIAPTDFQPGTVNLPEDIEVVNNDQQKTQRNFTLTSQIKLIMGDKVFIDVRGLTGRVVGSLMINYDPLAITTATGSLSIVKGKFNAYGQELTIKQGELIYTGGPIDNPGLNVSAIRKINTTNVGSTTLSQGYLSGSVGSIATPGEVTVGVNVTGTLKDYKVSLFSQPAIYSQSDILSMLILGTPASGVSGNKGQLLLKAATNLGLAGGEASHITQELQNTFGLDQLGIEDETTYDTTKQSYTQQPSVVVGKRVTNRIYISYSLGILDPISIVRLRFIVNRYITLQTTGSVRGTGGDVLLNYEY